MATTWNPADLNTTTLSNGNLTAASTGTAGYVRATDTKAAGSGKFYWETTVNTMLGGNTGIGFCPVGLASPSGASASGLCAAYSSGNIYVNGTFTTLTIGIISSTQIIGIALDTTAKLVWFRKSPSGAWNTSGASIGHDPGTGAGGISVSSILSIGACPLLTWGASGDQLTANFAGPFNGAVPSGFAAFSATDARVTQALAEHWLTTSPQAQITQVMAEHWMSTASTGLQAVVTQVMLEHWMSVAVVVPASGGPQVTIIQ